MSTEEQQNDYEQYCKRIEDKFDEYRKKSTPSSLPDIESEWRNYAEIWDIDTFLIPIIRGCNNLIYKDTLNKKYKALERLICHLKNIQEENEKIDLSFVLSWMQFHSARLNNLTLDNVHIDVLNDWLRICYDLEDRESAYYFTFYQLNRDQEMRHLVFDEEGQVREFFRSKIAPGRLYIPKLIGWFLRRYDLAAASALLDLRASDQVKPNETIKAGLGRRFPEGFCPTISLSILISLFLLSFASRSGYEILWLGYKTTYVPFFPLANFSDCSFLQHIQIWFVLPYVSGVLFIILAGLIFLLIQLNAARRQDQSILDLILLPRLFAGTLLGYIPLATASDTWKWLLRMPALPASISFLTMLLVALGYLFFEARKTLVTGEFDECMRRELRRRVWYVFSMGFLQSLLVGIFLCELFSVAIFPPLVEALKETTVVAVVGLVGYIFPKLILLYAPFALLLGIIIQLIWEDKTVTQPL